MERSGTGIRGVVEVKGPEARALLQRLITSDVEELAAGQARYAALLSPQGKILVDFLVVSAPSADGSGRFLLDCPALLAPDLARRLTLYRLRAQVSVADLSSDLTAVPLASDGPEPADTLSYQDPRAPALGLRVIGPRAVVAPVALDDNAYRVRRIAAVVPEGGVDFRYGDAFPHEANLDRLTGVDFGKGCYVGQEVVSRMQHRSSVRTRVTPFTAEPEAPASGTEIRAGDLPVGTVGSVAANRGLALVRLDRVADAAAAGVPLRAGGAILRIVTDGQANRPSEAT